MAEPIIFIVSLAIPWIVLAVGSLFLPDSWWEDDDLRVFEDPIPWGERRD